MAAAGGRKDAYVSRVRASSHAAGRAYVSKSGYRFDDFTPYLYRSDDFGATWTSIAGNLPREPINVVFEDARNPDLLFVGNDTGVFVSLDRGGRWVKMNNNMPNVPVHDLLVHPRENDLVLGTYGRDFWITNVGALQELTAEVLARDAHLFSIKPTVQRITWSFGANDYLFGQRHLQTPNEPNGMLIRYYLRAAGGGPASIVITDQGGQEVARFDGPAAAGINTVVWSMRRGPDVGNARGGGSGRGAGRGGGTRGGAGLDQLAPLGDYIVTLTIGQTKLTQSARIAKAQGWSFGPTPQTIR
jgi:BNR-Asp box repeat